MVRDFEGIARSLATSPSGSEHTVVIGVTNSKFPRFVLSEIQSPELAFSGDPISVPRIASYTRRVLRHLTVALFCRDLVSSIVNLTRQLAVSRSVPFGAALSDAARHATRD